VTITTALPRCPARACPVRYHGGSDRLCSDHQDSHHTGSVADRIEDLTGIMAAPGETDAS
jgi:hypothetical protein